MVSLKSIGQSVVSKANEKRGRVAILELDDRDVAIGTNIVLQYFPETIQDSLAVNYQVKDIPGAGGPLYQYISTGARTLSFVAVFTSDLDIGTEKGLEGARDSKHKARNVDIRAAVAALRQYMLPTYGNGQTLPPRKLYLSILNSGIGMAGGETFGGNDSMFCIMTQCEVTWEAYFPSGLPRVASVALQFTQISQRDGAVSFPRRDQKMLNYWQGPSDNTIPYKLAFDAQDVKKILDKLK